MRQRTWLLPMIVFAMSVLLLNACNVSTQGASTPASFPLTASQTSISAIDTAVPPTLVPPSATPTLNPINSDTVTKLEMVGSFELGDVVRSLAFTPNGRALAAVGGNNQDLPIQLWDMASGESLGALSGHTGIVWGAAFSPDGRGQWRVLIMSLRGRSWLLPEAISPLKGDCFDGRAPSRNDMVVMIPTLFQAPS